MTYVFTTPRPFFTTKCVCSIAFQNCGRFHFPQSCASYNSQRTVVSESACSSFCPRVVVAESAFFTFRTSDFPFPNPSFQFPSPSAVVSESQFPNPRFLVSECACLVSESAILVCKSMLLVSESARHCVGPLDVGVVQREGHNMRRQNSTATKRRGREHELVGHTWVNLYEVFDGKVRFQRGVCFPLMQLFVLGEHKPPRCRLTHYSRLSKGSFSRPANEALSHGGC